jgi:hypothetical protein
MILAFIPDCDPHGKGRKRARTLLGGFGSTGDLTESKGGLRNPATPVDAMRTCKTSY